jgi:uridine kinase
VELKVVAIFGGGGLGKTTLAMEVYRKIKGDFNCSASVSVSRTPDLDQLLKDVLSEIDEAAFSTCQMERWKTDKLIRHIQKILTGKRYAQGFQFHFPVFTRAEQDGQNLAILVDFSSQI